MKKTYIQPSLKVVMLQQSDLIATSNPSAVSLRFNLEDDPEEDGYAD